MALDPKSVEPSLGHIRVREFDARLADLDRERKRIEEQRKLYAPAAAQYAKDQKKALDAAAKSDS